MLAGATASFTITLDNGGEREVPREEVHVGAVTIHVRGDVRFNLPDATPVGADALADAMIGGEWNGLAYSAQDQRIAKF